MAAAIEQLRQRRAELAAQLRGLDEAIAIVERAGAPLAAVGVPASVPASAIVSAAATAFEAKQDPAEGHSAHGLTKRAYAALQALGCAATAQEVASKCLQDKEQSIGAALYRMSDPKQADRKLDRILTAGEPAKFVLRANAGQGA